MEKDKCCLDTNEKRPLIGIFPSRSEGQIRINMTYLDAIYAAGGMPVPLGYTQDPPRLQAYAQMMDGFLFSGGVDVHPSFYGEAIASDTVEVDERRDSFEQAAFSYVYATGKPILGICRGIQVINVFMGGSLYQHMEGHRQDTPGTQRAQMLTVYEGSLLHQLIGRSTIMVNTFHHQNVKELACGLVADAVSQDGYIEALHAPEHRFLLGVQFHPEIYCLQSDDDHAMKIFRAFVDACRT